MFAWVLLAGLLAVAATPQATARVPYPPSTRPADSTRVDSLVHEAEFIVRQGWNGGSRTTLRLHEQSQLQVAARELQSWANQYLKPAQKQETVALRYFKYLVMAGRYYATAGDFALALAAYKQAESAIAPQSSLRVKAGKYAQELTAYKKRVAALAAVHPPGHYDYASIQMHLVGSPAPAAKTSDAGVPPDSQQSGSGKAVARDDGWGNAVPAPSAAARTMKVVKVLVAPVALTEEFDSL